MFLKCCRAYCKNLGIGSSIFRVECLYSVASALGARASSAMFNLLGLARIRCTCRFYIYNIDVYLIQPSPRKSNIHSTQSIEPLISKFLQYIIISCCKKIFLIKYFFTTRDCKNVLFPNHKSLKIHYSKSFNLIFKKKHMSNIFNQRTPKKNISRKEIF